MNYLNVKNNMNPNYRIELQPQLVEDSVLRAIAGHTDARLFWKERDRLYEMPESDDREKAFQSLNRSWFARLCLDKPLREVLSLWPILTTSTSRCVLLKARSTKNMGAELYYVPQESGLSECERRTIAVQLMPALLPQSQQFLDFLRHELLHLVDMLDPDFGYEPNFPKADAGPAYDALLQTRYGVLWDITIDGRLFQRGWLPLSARARHFDIFKRTFTGSAEKIETAFSDFFDHNSHTHRELVEFAQKPNKWLSASPMNDSTKGRCALCHFPTFDLIKPDKLRFDVSVEIKKHYPAWNASRSICRQCADLYEARAAHADNSAQLP
jgi:hypothetical protein